MRRFAGPSAHRGGGESRETTFPAARIIACVQLLGVLVCEMGPRHPRGAQTERRGEKPAWAARTRAPYDQDRIRLFWRHVFRYAEEGAGFATKAAEVVILRGVLCRPR